MRSRPSIMAINPPVLVPPIRSKYSQGRGVSVTPFFIFICSMGSLRMKSDDIPRMPPPSRERMQGVRSIGASLFIALVMRDTFPDRYVAVLLCGHLRITRYFHLDSTRVRAGSAAFTVHHALLLWTSLARRVSASRLRHPSSSFSALGPSFAPLTATERRFLGFRTRIPSRTAEHDRKRSQLGVRFLPHFRFVLLLTRSFHSLCGGF